MGFMMAALRQHLPRPFNSAMAVHCANYFQMILLRRVFSSALAQPTFPICPNKKPATSREPHLAIGDMSAGQRIGPRNGKNRSLAWLPLPPDAALRAHAAAAGVSQVGLRPPFLTPAAAFSHPD